MNIVEPILFQARNRPSELALAAPGTPLNLVSYARLAAMLSKVAHRLHLSNLREGDHIVLDIDDPLLRSIFALAAARLGLVILTSLDRDYAWPIEVTAVISSGANASSDRHIRVDYDWVLGQQADEDETPDARRNAGETPGFCCVFAERVTASAQSSCFGISHGLLGVRIGIQDVFFGSAFAAAPRLFTSENSATSLGFQLLVSTLSRGSALFLSDDQTSLFNALNTYQVESAVLSPKCLLDLVAFHEAERNSRCSLNNLFIVGRLPKMAAERAANVLGVNVSVGYYDSYLGPVASMPCHNYEHPENAVGFLLPGIACNALTKNNNGTLDFRSEFSAEILGDERQIDSHAHRHGSLRADGILLLEA